MPTLAPLRQHERRLGAIDDHLQRAIEREYRALRVNLLDQLDANGVGGLLVAINPAFDDLIATLDRQLAQALAAAEQAAVSYASEELRRLGDLVELQLLPELLASASELRRAELIDQARRTALSWIAWVRGQLLMEAFSFLASQAPAELVRDRLLSLAAGDGRVSVWRAVLPQAQRQASESIWLTANSARRTMYLEAQGRAAITMKHQAIAAIDERTTRTCLRVHGQIQPLSVPFNLTGTPRYADKMMGPPFHYNCRSSVVLYVPELEQLGIPTNDMRKAAQAELRARQQKPRRQEIHPAHATSRRS